MQSEIFLWERPAPAPPSHSNSQSPSLCPSDNRAGGSAWSAAGSSGIRLQTDLRPPEHVTFENTLIARNTATTVANCFQSRMHFLSPLRYRGMDFNAGRCIGSQPVTAGRLLASRSAVRVIFDERKAFPTYSSKSTAPGQALRQWNLYSSLDTARIHTTVCCVFRNGGKSQYCNGITPNDW